MRLLYALLLAACGATAQHTGAVRSGGQPVPGALVTATQGAARLATVTDGDGRYRFTSLPAGAWALEVRIFGFAPARRELTQAETPTALEWTLELAAAAGARTANGEFAALKLPELAEEPPSAPEEVPDLASEEAFVVSGSLSGAMEADSRADALATARLMQEAAGPVAGERAAPGIAEPAGDGNAPGAPRIKGRTAPKANSKLSRARAKGAVFGNRMKKSREAVRGSAHVSYRNAVLDARPYSFSGDSIPRAGYSQTRFGVSAGGVLHIPHLLETGRTTFFLSYSGARAQSSYSNVATVPTQAEREGDFSSGGAIRRDFILYDLSTLQPFPGNRIPASRIDPAARGLLDLMPLPNVSGDVHNYQIVTAVPQNTDSFSARLNQPLGRRHRLDFATAFQFRNSENAQLFGFRDTSDGSGINANAGWTHTVTPRAVLNLRGVFNRNVTRQLPFFAYKRDIAAELGIQDVSHDPLHWGPPNLSFTNYGDLQDGSPQDRRDQTASLSGSLLLVRGKHNLRTGGEYRHQLINLRTDSNARGSYTFSGLATSGLDARGNPLPGTGFDFADFLLGRPQSSNIRIGSSSNYLRTHAYSGFAQDDWRARARLTINAGMRYEFFAPFTEKYDHLANLDIASGFTGAAVVLPGQAGPYTGVFPRALVENDRNNFSPRVGLAWRPSAQHQTLFRAGYSLFFNGSSYNQFPTRLASQPPFASAGHLTTSALRVLTIQDGFSPEVTSRITNTYAVDRYYRLPDAQTWNFHIQQALPTGLILEAGYLGTKGTHLDVQRQPNRAAPGSPLTAEQRRQIRNAVGFAYNSSEGNSIYHAAQVRLTRRMKRGVSANAVYTFAKSIDNASNMGGGGSTVAQNDKDLRSERGLSSFDQHHILAVNSVFEFREWTLTGALSAASGTPYTARVLGNQSNAGGTGSIGSGRADATGLPLDGGRFFNPDAFAIPPAGRYGNAGRNTITGPSRFTLNASLARSIRLGDGKRRVELRLEGNNLTNQVNFNRIATVVNAIDYGLPTAALPMRSFQATARFRF